MANTRISDLAAGTAVSGTDLFPDVQTVGVGPVKVTAAQIKTYTSASPTLVTPNIGVATGTSLDVSGVLESGANGGTGGQLKMFGATSGDVTLAPGAVAGTATVFTLPASNGTNKYALLTNGSGVTSWGQIDVTAAITGIVPVANGGTGLASGTSGGVLYYSASGVLASSSALAANAVVLGGGAGAAPATTTTGTGVVTAIGNAVNATGGFITYATFAPASGKTLTLSNTLTFTGTDSSSVAFGTGGTVTYTSNNLSVFASTTSAQLAGVISDETGTGSLVFSASPTFTGTVNGANLTLSGTLTTGTWASSGFTLSSSGIITESTTSRTLSASDNGKVIYCTSASATTITTATSLGAGFSVTIIQGGAGKVTVAQGASTTLASYSSLYSTMGQYAVVSLICPVADTFLAAGNLGV